MNRRKVWPTHKLAEWRKRMQATLGQSPAAPAPAPTASPETGVGIAAAGVDVVTPIEPA